jgi:hypothetical protein
MWTIAGAYPAVASIRARWVRAPAGSTERRSAVGLIEALGDDSLQPHVEGGLDEAFVDRERPRHASDLAGELVGELAEQFATLPIRQRAYGLAIEM